MIKTRRNVKWLFLMIVSFSRLEVRKMADDGKAGEAAPPVEAEFDMENLFKYFKECYGEDGSTLSMDSYIQGYEEIVKFLHLLGTVFGWVASDVVAKIGDAFQRGRQNLKSD